MRSAWRAAALVLCLALSSWAEASPSADSRSEVLLAYGIKAYNQGDFQTAQKHFVAAVAADPEQGSAHYWLGRTQVHLSDTRAAIASFEASLQAKRPSDIRRSRILTDLASAQLAAGDAKLAVENTELALSLDPEDATARYLYGVALAQQGDQERGRAEAEIGRAQDPSLPALPAQSVVPGTGDLLKREQLPLFELRISGDYGYDSNPAGLPDGLDLFDPDDPGERTGRDDGVATSTLRAEIHPFYDLSGWSLGLRADAFRSWYNELDQFDLGRAAGVAQLAWGKDPLGYLTGPLGYTRVPQADTPFSMLFQAGTAYTELDDEGLSRTYDAAAAFKYWETTHTATQLEFAYQDITSFSRGGVVNADGLSGHEILARASQYLYFGERDRYLRVLAEGGESNRRDSAFDAFFLGGGVEVSWPLLRGLYLQFASSAKYEDFDEEFAGDSHDETLFSTTAALIWGFADHLYLTARGSYFDRDADPGALDDLRGFDRALGSLGLTFYY